MKTRILAGAAAVIAVAALVGCTSATSVVPPEDAPSKNEVAESQPVEFGDYIFVEGREAYRGELGEFVPDPVIFGGAAETVSEDPDGYATFVVDHVPSIAFGVDVEESAEGDSYCVFPKIGYVDHAKPTDFSYGGVYFDAVMNREGVASVPISCGDNRDEVREAGLAFIDEAGSFMVEFEIPVRDLGRVEVSHRD